jgi:hypothetical protein
MRLFFFLISGCLLSGCLTVRNADLRVLHPANPKLPSLTPKIDMQSVQKAYVSDPPTTRANNKALIAGVVETARVADSGFVISDKRQQDLIALFGKDVRLNICDSGGGAKGSIELKVTFGDATEGWRKYFIPAVLTGGLAWLFGMPLNTVTQELELQLTIKNADNVPVAKYTGNGLGWAKVAAYNGYKKTDGDYVVQASVGRKANIEAYNRAMKVIKDSLAVHYLAVAAALR